MSKLAMSSPKRKKHGSATDRNCRLGKGSARDSRIMSTGASIQIYEPGKISPVERELALTRGGISTRTYIDTAL